MKPVPVWRIAIRTNPQAEEAVRGLLEDLLGTSCASYTDLENRVVDVAVYLEKRPPDFPALRATLEAGLRLLAASEKKFGVGRLSVTRVRAQDWTESWKRHFKPIDVGGKLLIRPSWSRQRPHKGQSIIVLDPGLSFGTGQHATTRFCLEQIVAWRDAAKSQSFLDVGTGSGILALAAARVGYRPTIGLDNDPDAVRVARTNARLNGLARHIRFHEHDITQPSKKIGGKFSLVCANLIAPLLLEHRQELVSLLAAPGRLVLAGILRTEFPRIRRAYQALGLAVVAQRPEKEWHSVALSGTAPT
jgi:ribosomal protein L11 methyltransferase